jgi:hypothetical protein
MTVPVPLTVTVYMDQRDITKWCRSVKWSQADTFLERTWEVTTHAWSLFDPTARYDIYASYDPSTPRDTCVIRQGYVVSDQRMRVRVNRDSQPLATIQGKSYSSRSFRLTPDETLILVPAPIGVSDMNMARRVLQRYDGPVGRIRVLGSCYTLKQMVLNIARRAQFNANWNAMRIPMQPVVIPPQMTYWEAILQLIEPYALDVFYSEWHNDLTFVDPVSRYYGGQPMNISGQLVNEVEAVPINRKRPRRVIVKVPAWP